LAIAMVWRGLQQLAEQHHRPMIGETMETIPLVQMIRSLIFA
jgi:hypothetical protein